VLWNACYIRAVPEIAAIARRLRALRARPAPAALVAVPGGRLEATIRVTIALHHFLGADDAGFYQRLSRAGILDACVDRGRVDLVMHVHRPTTGPAPETVEGVHAIALKQLRERLDGICRPDAPLLALQVEAAFDEHYGLT
jgi:hypothetical protein